MPTPRTKEWQTVFSAMWKLLEPEDVRVSTVQAITKACLTYHTYVSAEERRRRQAGKTHWDGCWKDHLDCAVENVQRLVKAATEVERISSRDHNAWARDHNAWARDHNAWAELREALAPFKEE